MSAGDIEQAEQFNPWIDRLFEEDSAYMVSLGFNSGMAAGDRFGSTIAEGLQHGLDNYTITLNVMRQHVKEEGRPIAQVSGGFVLGVLFKISQA